AFLRVFLVPLGALSGQWRPAVAVLAVVTMVVGHLGALGQGNVKRMLAYSSIAHAGYLLTAVVAAPAVAAEAVLFYLVAYAAVNLGAFGALADRRPVLAAALTLFLISLTGVPVSAGFVGKFYLFNAAVSGGYAGLAVIGVLMSVVSAYSYLRVVVAMYMREAVAPDTWAPVGGAATVALTLAAAVVLGLGVYPGPVLAWARMAAES